MDPVEFKPIPRGRRSEGMICFKKNAMVPHASEGVNWDGSMVDGNHEFGKAWV